MKDGKRGTAMRQKELWVNTDLGAEKGTFEVVYGTNCLRLGNGCGDRQMCECTSEWGR